MSDIFVCRACHESVDHVGGVHVHLLFLTASGSLTQQTGRDPVTPGCQGESAGAMAAAATVGESQLQRIIRDLHGTTALCVCA